MPSSLISVVALLLHPPLTPAVASAQAQATVPRFERAACPIGVAPDERIDCGVLVVRENRHNPASGPIRLPVMIFRSRGATRAADPILFMPGGPGNSAVAGRRSGKGIPFLDDRDYIVLEQRGTRYAQPALECPAINAIKGEIAAGRLRDTAARTALVKAAAACRTALVAAGADLDGYTSDATADDIEELRTALGFENWNLYGPSHSTRLMLTALRRHPGGVRSVVLDSVLPPEVNFDEVSAANLLRALDLVYDGAPSIASAAPRIPMCGGGSRIWSPPPIGSRADSRSRCPTVPSAPRKSLRARRGQRTASADAGPSRAVW